MYILYMKTMERALELKSEKKMGFRHDSIC